MYLALLLLYLPAILVSGFSIAENTLPLQWTKPHEHDPKDIRTSGYEGESNKIASVGSSLSHHMKQLFNRGPQEFNVSGMLKMVPVNEPTCNEKIIHMYTNICSGTAVHRVRRGLFEADDGQELVKKAESEYINHDLLKSLLMETIQNSISKRASLIENENNLQKSMEDIMQKCCVSGDPPCTFESVKKELHDLCKPGSHGSRFILNA